MIIALEIIISVLFFLNKIFLLRGKKMAWVVGAIGGILAIIYFYVLGLYIYTILEVGMITLMVYGLITIRKAQWFEWFVRIVTVLTMLAVSYFAYRGLITYLELVSSIGVLVGTYLMVKDQNRVSAWVLYLFYNICAIYITLSIHQYIFMVFQILSVPLAIFGIIKESKSR